MGYDPSIHLFNQMIEVTKSKGKKYCLYLIVQSIIPSECSKIDTNM